MYMYFTVNERLSIVSKVDRSPTGSGVTARIATQYHKRQIKLGTFTGIKTIVVLLHATKCTTHDGLAVHRTSIFLKILINICDNTELES